MGQPEVTPSEETQPEVVQPETVMLDIVRGPKKPSILEALGPLRQHVLSFWIMLDGAPTCLRLEIDGCRYDRFNANAIIANGKLINPDERAKDFCSQVQFHYDCTCATGKIRMMRQAIA